VGVSLNKKSLLVNVALLLFSLLFCALLLEGITRFMLAQRAANVLCVYKAHPVLGWALQPNARLMESDAAGGEYANLIETNSRGERNPEVEVTPEKFLVVGLGDSFTFGSGVEEGQTYLRLLENGLRGKGKEVLVLNTGVGSYNTKQELDMLELYLQRFDVDLAILGFFTGNDIYGNLEDSFRYEIVNGCLKNKPPAAEKGDSLATIVRNFLRANFKSYGFFAEKVRAVPILREGLMSLGLMRGKRAPLYLLSLQNPPNETMELAWNETEKQLERANEIAKEHNIKIVILDIPSSFQVSDELMKEALNAYGVSPWGFDFAYPERKIRELLEDKPNLVFVETLDEFRQSGKRLYYSKDPHWTPEGHALAAEILERKLLEMGLV
jgi:hypothetical protein